MTRELLLRMLDAMHRNPLDRRDRALLLVGFMGALPRSRLIEIDVEDVEFTTDAMLIRVMERRLALPATGGDLCPVAATRKWVEHCGLTGGALFRRFDRAGDPTTERLDAAYVSIVVKQRLAAVGVEPAQYSAHSLRSGGILERRARGTR